MGNPRHAAGGDRRVKPEPTMTMVFREQTVLDTFIGLAKKNGLSGTTRRLEGRRTAVTVKGFKNKTARDTFLSTWSAISMERK